VLTFDWTFHFLPGQRKPTLTTERAPHVPENSLNQSLFMEELVWMLLDETSDDLNGFRCHKAIKDLECH